MNAAEVTSHRAELVAAATERRWLVVVVAILALLVAMMVVTGLHWAAMPPSRVETVDVRTLHLQGEFIDANLGTAVDEGNQVTVRVVAQQYSFEPPCLAVPADTPVTFRATSADAIHGFVIGTTNANTMLVPGFVTTFTTSFHDPGTVLMPCHEYCGVGHEGMWAHVQVLPASEFFARARNARRLACVAR
jgi:cytochrome c oxidase subunit 2